MAAFSQIIDDTIRELYRGREAEEPVTDLRILRDKFKRRIEQIKEIKARVDQRTEDEGGVVAVRAREAAAAAREEAERTAKEAEQADEMRGMREAAEGALARAGESEGFDVLEPASHRAVFAPATPSASGGDNRAAAAPALPPPRAAEAAAGGQAEARALARLCRRLMTRGGGGGADNDGVGPSPMDADDDDAADADDADEDDDAATLAEAAVAAVVGAYPFCPGAAAADARASGAAETVGRGCLRVLASPATAASTAVVLGAGVSLLARMGARDPELAAASDAPSGACLGHSLACGGGGSGTVGSTSGSSDVWVPAAPDFVALFRALGYGAAFVEAGGAGSGDGPAAAAAAAAAAASSSSSSSAPTPRCAAALQLALRALRHALELGGAAAVLQPGTSAADAAWDSTPDACASALACGLLRLRLDPSARAAALPALDAALGALLSAVPARDWPRVCSSAAALLGAPVAPSHRAAFMLLQELPTGLSPRAVQLQASGALALLRSVAQCLKKGGGDLSSLEPGAGADAGGNGGGGKRKRADGPAPSMWPTPQEVMSALGQPRVLLAAVNAAGGGAGGAGGGGGGGGGAAAGGAAGGAEDDDEDGAGAAAAAAATAPASKTGTAAAYWAAITAVDAADMVLWAHVDGALARARAAEDGGGAPAAAAPAPAAAGWTRTANAAWAKWLLEAGKQVRSISLHALRARLSELEHTYELVAGAVARA